MTGRLLALCLAGMLGCNAVLGLEERDRAPVDAEIEDSSVQDTVVTDVVSDDTVDDSAIDDSSIDTGDDAAVDSTMNVDSVAPPDTAVPDTSVACPTGTTRCGTRCVDLASDPAACGTCSNSCATGSTCVDKKCVCLPYALNCGTVLCQPQSRENCGMCGNNCKAPESICNAAASACTAFCPSGTTTCAMTGCTNTARDSFNCGSCGTRCAAGKACFGGLCRGYTPAIGGVCGAGFTRCPGFGGVITSAICVEGTTC
jgi:hypothetical protein